MRPAPPVAENVSRIQEPVTPGFEAGFTHCCGDFDHVMQVDCSDRLLRCYENQQGSWRQTYGRVCAKALEPSCYERGCIYVCD